MEIAHLPGEWRDLFMTIGSSAGALVGLLFIVVSLHFDRISELSDYNMRVTIQGARYNTLHLLTVLVEAVAVLLPQPLIGLRLPLTIVRNYYDKHITISHRGGFPTALIATVIAAYLLGAAGGAVLMRGLEWGLYAVALSCLIKIVRSVLTAWMLIFSQSHAQKTKQEG